MVRELANKEKSINHTYSLAKPLSEWNTVCNKLRPILDKRKEKGLSPIKLVCIAGIDYIYKGKVES